MKKKIGLFGGSFNPPHQGHLHVLGLVQKHLGLHEVYLVPTSQNPLKTAIEGANPEQRLAMTHLAAELLGSQFQVLDWEIFTQGPSYTVELLQRFQEEKPEADIYFILGLDHLGSLESWKSASKLLELSHWVFVSRPGFKAPTKKEELPLWIQKRASSMRFNLVKLKKGQTIQFVQLPEFDASGTQIRKWLRTGKKVDHVLPLSIESYIRQNHIYENLAQKNIDPKRIVDFCAQVLFEKKAVAVRGFDLSQIFYPCEYALVASGTSTRHAQALAENVSRAVKEEFGIWPQGTEGMEEGRWVVLDYGSVMIHLFYDFVRQEYSIEHLWSTSQEIPLQERPNDGSASLKSN